MHPKARMLRELEDLLRNMLETRYRGGDHAKLAHAQGCVDGFMRALLEGGIATRDEIMLLVREQRAAIDGPAIRQVHLDEIETAAA